MTVLCGARPLVVLVCTVSGSVLRMPCLADLASLIEAFLSAHTTSKLYKPLTKTKLALE